MLSDIEAGIIKIDGKALPGAVQRFTVGHQIIIDEIEIQDKDGHLKQPAGYDEGTVSVELALLGSDAEEGGDNAYTDLESIQALFRKTEGQTKPEIHDIANVHTAARGIKHRDGPAAILCQCPPVEGLEKQIQQI